MRIQRVSRHLCWWLFYFLLPMCVTYTSPAAAASAPATTTVEGIIYRANGSPASGTLLISWPAFTTANKEAVSAGTTSITIGQGGVVSIPLVPTQGSTPATVYKVVLRSADGTSAVEYWSVPSVPSATVASVRIIQNGSQVSTTYQSLLSAKLDRKGDTPVALGAVRYAGAFAPGSKTAGINEAISDLGPNGGTVILPFGTVTTSACVNLKNNVRLIGHGYCGIDSPDRCPTVIQNATTDLFCAPDTGLQGVVLEEFSAISLKGGGHIFNFNASVPVSMNEIRNVTLWQMNGGKSVLQATSAAASAGFFDNRVHHFMFIYETGNTVPAINVAEPAVSHLTFEAFRSKGSNTSSGTYAISIESTQAQAPASSIIVRDGVIEQPHGGFLNLFSTTESQVANIQIWDQTVTPANPVINIGRRSSSAYISSRIKLENISSQVGSASIPDIKIDTSITGATSFTIQSSIIGYLDGGGAGQPGIILLNTNAVHRQNVSYSVVSPSELSFRTTSPTGKSFKIWSGWPLWWEGYAFFSVGDVDFGGITPAGDFWWGGAPTSPRAKIQQSDGKAIFNGGVQVSKVVTGNSANTDLAGQLTLASGTASYTFSGTYLDPPVCIATDTTVAAPVKVTTTTTKLTLTGTGSDTINYVCVIRR
ncbi:MAG TPA: hypothetical protein VD837_06900 [Terriglobales bacterium]|nr:hypothetical protein [Terriglobales bacterium]